MGEIKSTLEIIMEKAKGFTVTEEEKKAFRKKEVEAKVKGLLLKCMDGLLNPEDLRDQISTFDEDDRAFAKEAVLRQCLDLIFPDTDNALAFDILDQSGVDITPIRALILRYNQEMDHKRLAAAERIRDRINRRGISGSAVIPNPDADPGLNDIINDSKKRFQKELREQISF